MIYLYTIRIQIEKKQDNENNETNTINANENKRESLDNNANDLLTLFQCTSAYPSPEDLYF